MVSLEDVKKAQQEIRSTIHRTPILTSSLLNERCGMQIFLKAEHLQKTGSFKIRGATNAVKQAVAGGARSITRRRHPAITARQSLISQGSWVSRR